MESEWEANLSEIREDRNLTLVKELEIHIRKAEESYERRVGALIPQLHWPADSSLFNVGDGSLQDGDVTVSPDIKVDI